MGSNYWEGFICPICNQGFTLAQWEDRRSGDNGEEYHEDCCPECNDPIDDDEGDIPGGFDFADDVNYLSDF